MIRFDLTLPHPTRMRVGKEAYQTLPPGTKLHRVHPSIYMPAEFNPTDQGDARFSPIRDSRALIVPTIYAAKTFACATCEIILRCPDTPLMDQTTGLPPFQIVFPSDFKGHSHSALETTQDLRLIDLTTSGQRKIGVDRNALVAGPRSTYSTTRAWAERLHATCPNAQGLFYSSIQHGPDFAILLFRDRIRPGSLQEISTRPVAAPACHAEIQVIARSLSIEYEDV